jgi:ABC-2 type transport system ATP-binding protein
VSRLEVEAVGRSFRTKSAPVTALHEVSFSAEAGEVVALLGLNGAGKTTLLKIISTLLLPTTGTVRVHGVDVVAKPRQARRLLSVVLGGDRGLYGRLSGLDNAQFFGTLAGLDRRELDRRTAEALAAVALSDVARRPVETYSKGMRQRLHLAIGLLTEPAVLLLDEPTIGLDPIEAARLRRVIRQLTAGTAQDRPCVLLTSHYLKDIEELADRVLVLQGGRLTHDMPLEKLLHQSGAAVVTLRGKGEPPRADEQASGDGAGHGVRLIETERSGSDEWIMRYEVDRWDPGTLTELAALWPAHGVIDVRLEATSLERVFADLGQRATERAHGAGP